MKWKKPLALLLSAALCLALALPAAAVEDSPQILVESSDGVKANTVYCNGVAVTIKKDADKKAYVFDGTGTVKLSDIPVGSGTTVYGGGKNTDVEGSTSVTVEDIALSKIYGGGYSDGTHSANVSGDTRIRVTGTVLASTVGGGYAEGKNGFAQANVAGTAYSMDPSFVEIPEEGFTSRGHNIVGGGYAVASSHSAEANVGAVELQTAGAVYSIRGGGTASVTTANPASTAVANVTGGVKIGVLDGDVREIYCGGSAGSAAATANVGSVDFSCTNTEIMIFRGGGTASGGFSLVEGSVRAEINSPNLYGYVVAGGDASKGGTATVGSTDLLIVGSEVPVALQWGDPVAAPVYGGGNSSGEGSVASVLGDAEVTIRNSTVVGTVYGGGSATDGGRSDVGSVAVTLDGVQGDLLEDSSSDYNGQIFYVSIVGGGESDETSTATVERASSVSLTDSEAENLIGGNVNDHGAPQESPDFAKSLTLGTGNSQIVELDYFDALSLAEPLALSGFLPAASSTEVTLTGDQWQPGMAALTYNDSDGEERWFTPAVGEWSYQQEDAKSTWTVTRAGALITVSSGEHGEISPEGPVEVPAGANQTFTFTPDPGYELDQVLVDGTPVAVTGNTYTFEAVRADHTLSASFKQQQAVNPPPTPTPGPTTSGDTTSYSPPASVSGESASSVVSGSAAGQLVQQAVENQVSTVVLAPKVPDTVRKTQVELPREAVTSLAGETEAGLQLKTPAGDISLNSAALQSIASQAAGSEISISVERLERDELPEDLQEAAPDTPIFELTVKSGGVKITDFGGGLVQVSLPYAPAPHVKPEQIKVYYLDDQGVYHLMEDVSFDVETQRVTFSTPHFSYYVVLPDATPFEDVADHWAAEAVAWAYGLGLVDGMTPTEFRPEARLTRAMAVTMLHRLAGSPGAQGSPFEDVPEDAWYAVPAAWAAAQQVADGVSPQRFAPMRDIIRQELAVLLYRYKGALQGVDSTVLSSFPDSGEISPWAQTAMAWAVEQGILTGRSGGALDPTGTATRAEAAAMLKRMG